ncbi:hypothetical protein D3C73_1302280 [compost metagenome]
MILFSRVPFHALSAVGIAFARQPDLVAIENTRGADEGEQEYDRELHPPLVFPQAVQQAGRIMAAQQIEDHFVGLLRIAHEERAEPVAERAAVHFASKEL